MPYVVNDLNQALLNFDQLTFFGYIINDNIENWSFKMFKKLAADALGLSDIGKVISPSDYDKTESDDYIFNEENEQIYFLIKSKSDEYCFTNQALIHLDGASAMSSKRFLKRYSYHKSLFSNVNLETAGTIDLDIEIKFSVGDDSFSIDVDKKQIEQLKDLYKALIKIASIQEDNHRLYQYAQKSLASTIDTVGNINKVDIDLQAQFKALNE